MTDVGLALHRQPTDVETRLALFKGHEVTDFAGRSVIEPERHRASLGTRSPRARIGNRAVVWQK